MGGFIRALAITFMFSQVKRMGEAPSPNCWQGAPDVSTHIGVSSQMSSAAALPLSPFVLICIASNPWFSRRRWTRILGRSAGAASLHRVSGVILAVAPPCPPPLGDREDMKGNPMRSGPNLRTRDPLL